MEVFSKMATNPFFSDFFAGNDTPYNNSNTLLGVGLGLLAGKTPQEQVANAATNFTNERQAGRTYNKTVEYLKQNNPDLAQALLSGAIDPASAYKLAYQQKLEAAKPKNNFLSAGGSLYNTDTGQWLTPPGGGSENQESFYGNPIAVQTPQGIQYGQIGNRGSFKPIQIGEGNTFAPAVKTVDTGTGTTFVGPGGVQVGSPIQKDIAGAEYQKATGKGEGEATSTAQAALPSAQAAAQQIDLQVQDLKNDPYLPSMLGPINSRTPEFTSNAGRVRGKINQLKGGAFLQARQLLKGGGAITDFEGQKAEQAYTRMEEAQSVDDFNRALDDFNTAVQNGVRLLQDQAAGGAAPTARGARRRYNPQTGKVE